MIALMPSVFAFQAGATLKAPLSSPVRMPVPVMTATAGVKQVPHGGTLVDLMVPTEEAAAVVESATVTIELTDRQSCDVELLCNGAFSPLTGFLTEEEYDSVVENMRLPSDIIMAFPWSWIPTTPRSSREARFC